MAGTSPAMTVGGYKACDDVGKDDRPAQPPMHGWVEANFTRIGPNCDLEPFFREI
jgi:hypothetical protein